MLVSACLPSQVAMSALERGYLSEGTCPSGVAPVGKVIAALPGDTVDVTDSGSFVNGSLLPGSAPLLHDSKGRAMPRLRGRFILSAETAWLYSGHSPRSFDSRYYGPVPFSGLRGQLFPLLTWGQALAPSSPPPEETNPGNWRASHAGHPVSARSAFGRGAPSRAAPGRTALGGTSHRGTAHRGAAPGRSGLVQLGSDRCFSHGRPHRSDTDGAW